MYQLKECRFDGKDEYQKVISQNEAENLMKSFEFLGTNMTIYQFYQIVKRNLNDLINFINCSQNKQKDQVDIIEANRFLYNFLDTFYSFVNYFESNYKTIFQPIKNKYFDSYFEYRFLYTLRNYVIHEDLAVTISRFEYGEDYIKCSFLIPKQRLIDSAQVKKKIKVEISNFDGNDIDILPILNKAKKIICNLVIEIIDTLKVDIINDFALLAGNIPNQKEVFLVRDDKIINGILNVMNKFIKSIAYNFIYNENLYGNNPNITSFYNELCFLYFKEKNAILPF